MAKAPAQAVGVEKLLYRREEAAFALGCSLRSIDYLIADGKLSIRKMGRNTVIPAAEVKRLASDVIRSGMPGDIRKGKA